MAWNEPGKGGNPWNTGGRGDGPPDLDKLARDLQKRLFGLFGSGRGGRGGGSASASGALFGLVFAAALVLWALSGFYQVGAAERGVILQFGKYHDTTMPGLHWHIPWPVQTLEKVNVAGVESFRHSTRMLTADENIVSINIVVQYRRNDAKAYLFHIREPEETLGEVTESAIREVVGKHTLDYVLTEGRAEVANLTREIIQRTLNAYGPTKPPTDDQPTAESESEAAEDASVRATSGTEGAGLEVTSVNLQDANFPTQVEAAVQDAIKAREDQERLALEAQVYKNDIVPRARGNAARILEDAKAYAAQVVAEAEGDTDRFVALLGEYEKAPEVTRQRLYYETLERVLGNTNKVLLDVEGSGSLLYLPIEELMKRGTKSGASVEDPANAGSSRVVPESPRRDRSEDLRSRGD